MARDYREKRQRIGRGTMGDPDYTHHQEIKKFHPEADETMSTHERPEGNIDYEDLEDMWYEIEVDYRKRYPDITNGDVVVEPARFDLTIERIGSRIDKTVEEVRREIEDWPKEV